MEAHRPAMSGASEYTMFVPRRSLVTTPASRSTLRWWLIVGWLTVQHSVKSQAHTESSQAMSCRTMERRTGSASAWRNRTSSFMLSRTISIWTDIDNDRYSQERRISANAHNGGLDGTDPM